MCLQLFSVIAYCLFVSCFVFLPLFFNKCLLSRRTKDSLRWAIEHTFWEIKRTECISGFMSISDFLKTYQNITSGLQPQILLIYYTLNKTLLTKTVLSLNWSFRKLKVNGKKVTRECGLIRSYNLNDFLLVFFH